MAAPGLKMQLNEEIEHISLHNSRNIIFHAYIFPYVILHMGWLYFWLTNYGYDEYFEVGMIGFVIVGLLQILTTLFCLWFVQVRVLFTCSTTSDPYKAKLVKVVPTPNNGFTELVKLHHDQDADGGQIQLWFQFQKMKYIYDSEEKKQFRVVEFPIDHSFKHYMDSKGYVDDIQIKVAQRTYGENSMVMDIPTFGALFTERAIAPFFVFQVFCVGLWCLDEYWYYSVFTLFMLVAFEATLVQQQLRNMAEIRKMGNKPYNIYTYRSKKWKPIPTDELLPGDIVSVGRSQEDRLIPCDLLLLRGPCIIDESMLTGESVPVMKEAVENLELADRFDIESHGKLHVLYGGTKIVQHSADKSAMRAPDGGCIAYVLRNSFSTSQGKLLRTILFGVKRVTANNMETFMFISFLLVFAVAAAGYVWNEGTKDETRSKYKLFLECTLILTSVVPPELPIELSLAVNTSLLALTKLYVFCTEPFRIPFAGKIDICCFDKTGTLTSDSFLVEGIAGIKGSSDIIPVSEAPPSTVHILASCHSLAQLDNTLVGDPLEKATLQATEWNLTKNDSVLPRDARSQGLKIIHRFHFSSALRRMSVLTGYTTSGNIDLTYKATVKGAPEMLRNMFAEVPRDYDEVYLQMARRGARVLALGYKNLGVMSQQQARELTREQIESELVFAGFVVISCPLKHDSKAVIKEIRESSHHVVMITGDNPLTACHVAREIKIIRKPKTLVLTAPNEKDSGWHWQSIDDTVIVPVSNEPKSVKELRSTYDLCITGEGLEFMKDDRRLLKNLLMHIKVHARVAPKQKEFVITTLRDQGLYTLMCGDGTNDVGALKHAHIGVALLANAPERLQSKKKRPTENNVDEDHSAVSKARGPTGGKTLSRAGKMRAVARGDTSFTPSQKKIQAMMKEMEQEEAAQVVRLGDASIASPFTYKLSNTTCVCHIIKQGRCTLVTTLQMFKILALNALILAYSQSVLYLDGVKFSDTQATLQGLLLAGCFLFISRSKPLKVLSKNRPLPNIFNVYTILSVVLQFCIHFCSLIFLKLQAEERSPPKAEKFADLEKEFEPTLMNTTIYLISMGMQISTFAVNYKGHPFMESLFDNKPLLYSLMVSCSGLAVLASGIVPELSAQFELVYLEPEFRYVVLSVLVLDMTCSFFIDRILQYIFGHSKLRKSL